MDRHKDFFNFLSDNFNSTYWLPGNHEYYHSDIKARSGFLHEKIRDNVLLVNNTAIEHEGVNLIFSTLWSRIGIVNEWEIRNSMADFKVIMDGDGIFDVTAYNALHINSMDFLRTALADRPPGKTIVVSHNVPTFQHYPEQYKGSVLNEAFAVELSDLIMETSPDYWIYGHTHGNTEDFEIGNTKLLTNQLGYVKYKEHLAFQDDKCITI
jgi:predicted phosphohydrolase